jgi:hypothetical protein
MLRVTTLLSVVVFQPDFGLFGDVLDSQTKILLSICYIDLHALSAHTSRQFLRDKRSILGNTETWRSISVI